MTVFHVDATILLALVKGLVDVDTKGEILSKVKQIDLDETVAFVEDRETGKRDLVLLGGVPLASQANGVQVQASDGGVVKRDTKGKRPLQ